MKVTKVFGNRYLIVPDEVLKEKDNIIIPDSAKDAKQFGTVILNGVNAEEDLIGKHVMFHKHGGIEVESEGVLCLLVPSNLLLCER